MEQVRSARKFGIAVVLLTLLFRLFELGLPQLVLGRLPELFPSSIQKETERKVRSFSFVYPFESSAPMDHVPEPRLPVFTAQDARNVPVVNSSGQEPDYESLLAAPLDWQLDSGTPTVLILHTHTSESYEKGSCDYPETAAYRTLEEEYNMLSIGEHLAECLEEAGIRVIHDRQFHDYPAYSTAYTHARRSIQQLLKENPGIQLVLDLHRDAADDAGSQLRTQFPANGSSCAQLMLVLGAGNAGLPNEHWQNNLSLAMKLQSVLQAQNSELCRPISLRAQRFNQDLAPYTLLVEVGAAGDSRDAALNAAEELAKGIAKLKHGTC